MVQDERSSSPLYRLFHLDAPAGPDPEARQDVASVRQAVSPDLVRWQDVGPVLQAGSPGTWDDKAIWTGSVRLTEDGTQKGSQSVVERNQNGQRGGSQTGSFTHCRWAKKF